MSLLLRIATAAAAKTRGVHQRIAAIILYWRWKTFSSSSQLQLRPLPSSWYVVIFSSHIVYKAIPFTWFHLTFAPFLLFLLSEQEPVQGEGGYVMPPKSFMKGIRFVNQPASSLSPRWKAPCNNCSFFNPLLVYLLRDICDKNDILMITDEVQSGFGRHILVLNLPPWRTSFGYGVNLTKPCPCFCLGLASTLALSTLMECVLILWSSPRPSHQASLSLALLPLLNSTSTGNQVLLQQKSVQQMKRLLAIHTPTIQSII